MQGAERFFGKWQLDIERSEFQYGIVPRQGEMLIEPVADGLRIRLDMEGARGTPIVVDGVWTSDAGPEQRRTLTVAGERTIHQTATAASGAKIAAIQLKVLEQRLAKMDLTLQVSPAALEELAKVGFDPVFGARPLKRAIQQRIENPLSRLILEGRFGPKSVIPVEVDPVREPGVFHFGEPVPAPEMAK